MIKYFLISVDQAKNNSILTTGHKKMAALV